MSQVSVVTKIVPSPDWFIGLSSIELCRNGHFIDRYEEEVGTDEMSLILFPPILLSCVLSRPSPWTQALIMASPSPLPTGRLNQGERFVFL